MTRAADDGPIDAQCGWEGRKGRYSYIRNVKISGIKMESTRHRRRSVMKFRALMGPTRESIVEKRGLDQMGIADRIGALRLESGRSEHELANELGLTVDGYCDLEQQDSELESVLSIAQALKLANLLGTNVLGLLGEAEQPLKVPIARVRSALAAHLGSSAEAKEALEDEIDWNVGPFLEGSDEWMSVYTIEFIKKLAMAIQVDWQIVLAGISNG